MQARPSAATLSSRTGVRLGNEFLVLVDSDALDRDLPPPATFPAGPRLGPAGVPSTLGHGSTNAELDSERCPADTLDWHIETGKESEAQAL